MDTHHPGRRTAVPPPPAVWFPPLVTDPSRPECVERAYAEIGYRLLEGRQQFGLTPAELLSVMVRCGQDQLANLVKWERASPGLGRSAELEPGPVK